MDLKVYICRDLKTRKLFATMGNYREKYIGKPKYKWEIDSEIHESWTKSDFGFVSNISSGIIPEPYRIVFEYDWEEFATFPKYDSYNVESRRIFKEYF